MTHKCVSKLTTIGSENGLSPGRRQAIIWTSAGILLIGPLGTNFSETLFEIHTVSFRKMHLKMSSGKWQPFCFGLDVLTIDFDIIDGIWFNSPGVDTRIYMENKLLRVIWKTLLLQCKEPNHQREWRLCRVSCVFQEKVFQRSVPSQCRETVDNANIFCCWNRQNYSARKGLTKPIYIYIQSI